MSISEHEPAVFLLESKRSGQSYFDSDATDRHEKRRIIEDFRHNLGEAALVSTSYSPLIARETGPHPQALADVLKQKHDAPIPDDRELRVGLYSLFATIRTHAFARARELTDLNEFNNFGADQSMIARLRDFSDKPPYFFWLNHQGIISEPDRSLGQDRGLLVPTVGSLDAMVDQEQQRTAYLRGPQEVNGFVARFPVKQGLLRPTLTSSSYSEQLVLKIGRDISAV